MLKALSVKQFNQYVKTNFKHDPIFMGAFISGALANIRKSHNHLYFSLKEESDIIDCVIYYYEDQEIDFDFREGTEVFVKGNLSYNNYSSRLVVVTKSIEKKGISEEYLRFLKIKEDFQKRGYFDIENKKPIPKFPKNIGLITSKDGAAIVDFVSVIDQKPNAINISLYPVKVQGSLAVSEVITAIEILDKRDLDLIVITRGGGSSEDLAVFNDKEIIETVFKTETPVISAIGHKIDTTLLDLVADLSLQTPTEAGSYIISNYKDLEKDFTKILAQMENVINSELRIKQRELDALYRVIISQNPMNRIKDREVDLRALMKSFDKTLTDNYRHNEAKLSNLGLRLKAAKNIIDIKKESIEILNQSDGKIFSKHSLSSGDEFFVEFSDGRIKAVVIDG